MESKVTGLVVVMVLRRDAIDTVGGCTKMRLSGRPAPSGWRKEVKTLLLQRQPCCIFVGTVYSIQALWVGHISCED